MLTATIYWAPLPLAYYWALQCAPFISMNKPMAMGSAVILVRFQLGYGDHTGIWPGNVKYRVNNHNMGLASMGKRQLKNFRIANILLTRADTKTQERAKSGQFPSVRLRSRCWKEGSHSSLAEGSWLRCCNQDSLGTFLGVTVMLSPGNVRAPELCKAKGKLFMGTRVDGGTFCKAAPWVWKGAAHGQVLHAAR